MNRHEAFWHAVKQAGGTTGALARAIKKPTGVSLLWQIAQGHRTLPPSWCEPIEIVTGVQAELLRPDLDWLRGPDGRLYWREQT